MTAEPDASNRANGSNNSKNGNGADRRVGRYAARMTAWEGTALSAVTYQRKSVFSSHSERCGGGQFVFDKDESKLLMCVSQHGKNLHVFLQAVPSDMQDTIIVSASTVSSHTIPQKEFRCL